MGATSTKYSGYGRSKKEALRDLNTCLKYYDQPGITVYKNGAAWVLTESVQVPIEEVVSEPNDADSDTSALVQKETSLPCKYREKKRGYPIYYKTYTTSRGEQWIAYVTM